MKKTFGLLIGLTLACCFMTGEAWSRGGGGGGGHGGGGGGHGGGFGGGYGHGGYGYGGYGGFGYGLGLGYGLGYGYGGYGGLGYGYAGYPYYGGYSNPNYGGYNYSTPNYAPSTYPPNYPPMNSPVYSTYDPNIYNSYYYAPAPSDQGYLANTAKPAPSVQVAARAPVQLEVIVPDSQARVWVDGKLTSSTGADRIYTTAPLQTGYSYTYNLKVVGNRAGHEVAVERQVQVVPGRLNRVDFTKEFNSVGTTSSVP